LNAQFTVLVDPNYVAPPYPTFKLLLNDEFNGDVLDYEKWDRSTSINSDDNPCGAYLYDFELNQVSVKDGNCLLKTEIATPANSQCPIDPNCQSGVSGEIKTFNINNSPDRCFNPDVPGKCFQSYDYPVDSYIEIRAKTPDPKCNAGAAFWLYGGDQEIDVFETANDEDDFVSGYWSGRTIKGEYYGLYEKYRTKWQKFWGLDGKQAKLVSIGFVMREKVFVEKIEYVWDEATQQYVKVTTEVASAGDFIHPNEVFITYGCKFTKEGLNFYINGQQFFNYVLDDYSEGELIEMRSKTVRLTAGALTVGGNRLDCGVECSSQMEVDYVRAYYPKDKNAITWADNTTMICSNKTDQILRAHYIPGVVYSCTSDAFNISVPYDKNDFLVIPKPNAALNVPHEIKLVTTFPDGNTETILRYLTITAGSAVNPPSNLQIECFNTFCDAEINESTMGCGCTTPNIYEWSDDNGISWHNYGTFYAFRRTMLPSDVICVRTKNCLGISQPICEDIPQDDEDPIHGGGRNSENTNELKFSKPTIFPNPSNGFINLSLPIELIGEDVRKNTEITISDVMSRVLVKKSVNGNEPIDISKLQNGIYFMTVILADNKKYTLKFIKLDKI
jgi:hypothetical protein